MPRISTVDMMFLDVLFEMEGGYVLDFSNRTFSEFFARDLGIDVDHPSFVQDGPSKGRRLRCFLRLADAATARRALEALWNYRQHRQQLRNDEAVVDAHGRFSALLRSLDSPGGADADHQAPPFATVSGFEWNQRSRRYGRNSSISETWHRRRVDMPSSPSCKTSSDGLIYSRGRLQAGR